MPFGWTYSTALVSPGSAPRRDFGFRKPAAVGVVPTRHRHIEEFLEGPRAGLAGLRLDDIEEQVLPVEQQVVVAEEDLGALGHGALRPGHLRGAGARDGGGDVLGRAARGLPHRLHREGRDRGATLTRLDGL